MTLITTQLSAVAGSYLSPGSWAGGLGCFGRAVSPPTPLQELGARAFSRAGRLVLQGSARELQTTSRISRRIQRVQNFEAHRQRRLFNLFVYETGRPNPLPQFHSLPHSFTVTCA